MDSSKPAVDSRRNEEAYFPPQDSRNPWAAGATSESARPGQRVNGGAAMDGHGLIDSGWTQWYGHQQPNPWARGANPYQPALPLLPPASEELFVAVNPFDGPARRRRQPSRYPHQSTQPDAAPTRIWVAPGAVFPTDSAPAAWATQPGAFPGFYPTPNGQFSWVGAEGYPNPYIPPQQGFPMAAAQPQPQPISVPHPSQPPVIFIPDPRRARSSSRSSRRRRTPVIIRTRSRSRSPRRGRSPPSPSRGAMEPEVLEEEALYKLKTRRKPAGDGPAWSVVSRRRSHSGARAHRHFRSDSRDRVITAHRRGHPAAVDTPMGAQASRSRSRSPTRVVAGTRGDKPQSHSPRARPSTSHGHSPPVPELPPQASRSRSRSPTRVVIGTRGDRSRSRSPHVRPLSQSAPAPRSRSPTRIVVDTRGERPPSRERNHSSPVPGVRLPASRSRSRSPTTASAASSRLSLSSPSSSSRRASQTRRRPSPVAHVYPSYYGRSCCSRSRSRSPRATTTRRQSPSVIPIPASARSSSRSRFPRRYSRSHHDPSRNRPPMIIPFYPPNRSPSNPGTRSHSPTAVPFSHFQQIPAPSGGWAPGTAGFSRDWMKWQPQAPAPQTESSPYSDAASSDGLPPPAISNGRRKGYLHGDLSLGAHAALTAAFLFVFDSIPRLFYLHLLLRIPSLYFSRVTRIFEDARLSLPDIKRMARARAEQWNPSENHAVPSMFLVHPDQQALPHSLLIFRSSWENFIDSLMREWKTLNVISVLLMSAILTMLQIDAAAAHPVTRTTALFSLICALMSLLYGCMYIIRFGTMRKMHKASSFANEAQKGTTSIWWNVWVLLAMPAVWLAWSIILFLACIMSFIWSSGSSQDTPAFDISPGATLGLRIGLTVVFSLGLIYFALIVRTFHRYGDPLDREWMRTVNEWTNQTSYMPYPSQPLPPTFDRKVSVPPSRSSTRHSDSAVIGRSVSPTSALHPVQIEIPVSVLAMNDLTRLQPAVPLTTRPSAFFKPLGGRTRSLLKSEPVTIMQLGPDVKAQPMGYANPMWANAIQPDDWSRFMLDVSSAWNGQLSLTRPEAAAGNSDSELPEYTVLAPARPDNPIPTSAESGGEFVVNSQRDLRSIGSSESSYGRVKTSDAGFYASAREDPSTEHDQDTSVPSRSRSLARRSPSLRSSSRVRSPPSVEPSTSPPQRASPPVHIHTVREFIALWNERYFHPRHIEASLVPLHDTSGPEFAVELVVQPSSVQPSSRSDHSTPNVPSVSAAGSVLAETASERGPSRSFATAQDSLLGYPEAT